MTITNRKRNPIDATGVKALGIVERDEHDANLVLLRIAPDTGVWARLNVNVKGA